MNKSNLIYNDDNEYLNDLFIYLDLYLEEILNEREHAGDECKSQSYYSVILDRIEMNNEIEILPRLESIIKDASEDTAKDFLRKFLGILVKRKLNISFKAKCNEVFGKDNPTLSDYMELLWSKDNDCSYETSKFANYLSIKDLLELILPEYYDSVDLLNAPIEADMRLVDYLIGSDAYVPPFTDRVLTQEEPSLLFMEDIISQEQDFMDGANKRAMLWGQSGGGKKVSLLAAAASKNKSIVYFFIPKENQNHSLYKAICYAEREAFFYNSVLAICGMENVSDESDFILSFKETCEWIIPNIFFLMDTEEEPEKSVFPRIEVGKYDEGNRQKLWEKFLNEDFSDCEVEEALDLSVLASTFVITPGKMEKALDEACGTNKIITKKGLYQACYSQIGHTLSDKASRIVSTMTIDDIKLGDTNMEYLKDIRDSILCRYKVHYEWNFKKKLPYGEGISIVFSGPPGTGKTMAAGVLANELGMEIYRIDLSQLMDKYVGETEKNIKSIFASASKMSCILFFDEADAIFNKRMDAQGANERFANIESALLLQCIEEYKGISILCTNDMGRIDSAFMRRFKYHMIFKNPDEAIRLEIWKGVFPEEAPLRKDIDFGLLANIFDISGALIKNIAVSSAYLAARDKKEIGMSHIMKAALRELEKNKMIISPEASNCIRTFLE